MRFILDKELVKNALATELQCVKNGSCKPAVLYGIHQ